MDPRKRWTQYLDKEPCGSHLLYCISFHMFIKCLWKSDKFAVNLFGTSDAVGESAIWKPSACNPPIQPTPPFQSLPDLSDGRNVQRGIRPKTASQCLATFFRPGLNMVHPMVSLRENMRQPAATHLAQADPSPFPYVRKYSSTRSVMMVSLVKKWPSRKEIARNN